MTEKIDAPVCFEGIVFLEDEDGNSIEATVTFGYGSVPDSKSVSATVSNAIALAKETTGKNYRLPSPRKFMQLAVLREYGQRVAIGGHIEEEYSMVANDRLHGREGSAAE